MKRQDIEHLLAALGALAFAFFISYFNTGAHAVNVETLSQPHGSLVAVGSSTPFTPPTLSLDSTPFSGLLASTTSFIAPPPSPKPIKPKSSGTPTPSQKPTPPAVTITPPAPTSTNPTTSPASPAPTPAPSAPSLLSTLAPSVVNILCLSSANPLHSISGSGIIIDSRGIILTDAHVAQEVLLQEYLGHGKVMCVARVGNPARIAYTVRPIYISSAWIHANSTTLISSEPTGTGEHDFALLGITGSANGGAFPSAFPGVAITDETASAGDSVGVGSYGAQELSTTQVENDLVPTLAMSTVKDVYTFDTNTVDVLAIQGNIAAQEGSSGGAIVNSGGKLIALITTSDVSGATSSREMRGITLSYIERALRDDTGTDISGYLGSKSVTDLVNAYAPTAQSLGQYLAQAIGLQP